MMRDVSTRKFANSGFTLIEALVATVLMGMILTALATITGQLLPNWHRGFARVQRSETLSTGLDRLVAELSAAEFITANRVSKEPLFVGTEFGVTFVRTAIGPNAQPGLDIVHIGEEVDNRNATLLVRSRISFAPFATDKTSIDELAFNDPVVLIRAPFRISFAYAGSDGVWKTTWQKSNELPAAVQLTVRNSTNGRYSTISTVAMVHVDAPAAIVCGASCESRAVGEAPAPNVAPQLGSRL